MAKGRHSIRFEKDSEPVSKAQVEQTDVALIGSGIMSATLGALLRLVEPDLSITLIERLDAAASESSDPWNNAGTGHSALCELNYTPQKADGSIDITKAITVNEQFQVSRQFWAYAVENGVLPDVRGFLNPIPHVSYVHGADKVEFLRKRHEALVGNPLFAKMEFIDDDDEFARRLPLMAAGRDFTDPVGLNWSQDGTDVDFGELSKQLVGFGVRSGTSAVFGTEVRNISRESDGGWLLVGQRTHRREAQAEGEVRLRRCRRRSSRTTAEGRNPGSQGLRRIPGQWCFPAYQQHRPDRRTQGQGVWLPATRCAPMSAPHLDTRVINGKEWLLFGPFAGWSPKFLKMGKVTDLPASIKPNNLLSMVGVGLTEFKLATFLLSQLALTPDDRIDMLREFAPKAQRADWELITAGQRVQVIRPAKGKGGALEFGTMVLNSADGSIAGLLGASPGASTAVPAMLDVMQRCFPDRYSNWMPKLKEMIPSLGISLSDEPSLFGEVWDWGTRVLGLEQ